MKANKLMKAAIIIGMCTALATGCSQAKKSGENAPLHVQFVPTNNDGSLEAKVKPLEEYLTKKLGRKVEVTMATDYSTIVEAMASKKVDIGIMPPAAYLQAREQGAAKALLTSQLGATNEQTGKPEEGKMTKTFKAEILVKADSDIKTLADLKGKKIAALNPASASGYIYPVAEMKEIEVDPVKSSTVTTVNDIPSEMTAVLSGQQDACFVFQGARNVFAKKFEGKDLFKELRVLYLTKGNIPNDAIAVSPDMPEDLQKAITDAFLTMKDDEAGKTAMTMWSHKGYEAADEKDYDTIKAYMEKAAE